MDGSEYAGGSTHRGGFAGEVHGRDSDADGTGFALSTLVLEAVVPGGGVAMCLFTVVGTLIGGAISGVILALGYNVLASVVGGVELELSET